MRDLILPKKAEEMRAIFMRLDATAIASLHQWSTEYVDKYPHFERESLAVLAMKDLFVMCDIVLGFNAKSYGSDMNRKLHGYICGRLDKRIANRQGWLIAREHLKTQIITIADSIRRVAVDPNPPAVIISGVRDNAVKMLGAIKAQWDSNETLQRLYPYRLPDKRRHAWNQDVLEFNGRTVIQKDPCLEARGAESELTSAHWKWAKFDDLVGRENSATDEQLAKTIEWWRAAQPLLTPGCEVDIIGTRYADNDLYGWLQDIKSPISWVTIPVTMPDGKGGEKIVWPEYHTPESLAQKKIDMGPNAYSSQMLVDPIPKGESEFKESWFHFYKPGELVVGEVRNRGTVCDPAYTAANKASQNVSPDSSAVITGGWHPKHGLVVLEIDHGVVGVEKTVDWLHVHQSAFGSKVGVETQSAMEDYLNLHNQQRKGKYIQWSRLKSGNHNKDSRIRTLIPTLAQKPIWLPDANPHSHTLVAQFLRFPKAKKRDLMDATAYLPQLVRAVKRGTAEDGVTFDKGYEPDSEMTGY
jgi:hypothetical protein